MLCSNYYDDVTVMLQWQASCYSVRAVLYLDQLSSVTYFSAFSYTSLIGSENVQETMNATFVT